MVLSCAERAARTFKMLGTVVPLNARKGVFHLNGKDNIDSDVSSRIANQHFHGTSMSLFLFTTSGNL